MKNQYFGDIGDYKKFGILKCLSDVGGFKILVCWLLTNDDTGSDGRFIKYLTQPEVWRNHEKDIFDFLRQLVLIKKERNLKNIERSTLLRNITFYSEVVDDKKEKRVSYFQELWRKTLNYDIVFFDPDNGIEVASVKCGSKNSSKYIYLDEIDIAFEKGHSLLIYQHFNRSERIEFMRKTSQMVAERLQINSIYCLKTQNSFFLIVPQKNQIEKIDKCVGVIARKWKPQITTYMLLNGEFRELTSTYVEDLFNQSIQNA